MMRGCCTMVEKVVEIVVEMGRLLTVERLGDCNDFLHVGDIDGVLWCWRGRGDALGGRDTGFVRRLFTKTVCKRRARHASTLLGIAT